MTRFLDTFLMNAGVVERKIVYGVFNALGKIWRAMRRVFRIGGRR